jgi:hypothetical protein
MNRLIKFKAYDKHTKKQVTDPMSFYMSMDDNGTLNVMHNIIVCQFTGLLDKNGKEIYEGDWIQHDAWDYPFKVVWFEHKARFVCELKACLTNHIDGKNSVVVGNIHEHPKLIEKSV